MSRVFRTHVGLLGFLLMLPFARAQAQEPSEAPTAWLTGSNAWGGRGGMRLDAAHPVRAEAIVVTWASVFSESGSFFVLRDSFYLSDNRLSVLWSPVARWEVALGYGLKLSGWHDFANAEIQALGDPTVTGKYSVDLAPGWAAGLMLHVLVPESVTSATLVPKASTLTIKGLGSYRAHPRIELTANVGAIIDGSGRLAGTDLLPNKRLVYGVNRGSGASLGLGALGQFDLGRVVALSPFVEITGDFVTTSHIANNPVRATAGVKGTWLAQDMLELMLGADVRLIGAPRTDSPLPGALPWSVFAVVGLHLFDHPPAPVERNALPCAEDADCPKGQLCRDAICRYAIEVIKDVTTIQKVAKQMFTVSGKVLDATSSRPVDGAKVIFTGFEYTPVVPERRTGAFHSFPLPVGEGLLPVKVSAPGYKIFEQVIQRGTVNQNVELHVALRPLERADLGTLRGGLNDNRRGRPVQGSVTVVDLKQVLQTNALGQFSATIKTGTHDLLIEAEGYISQKKHITLHDGEIIILNLDMARRHNAHRRER